MTLFDPGSVIVLGAGPGDPELITVKGHHCLQQADVIVYDRLVNNALLELAPAGCKNIYVGKRKHLHSMRQCDINATLIEHARQGLRVVRLKGGDPFIFGRGGEEIDALNEAHVPWVVVPGITAATGAAASVGLSLTHRLEHQAVTFITAHIKASPEKDSALCVDWELALRPNQTVVFYMGLTLISDITRELLSRGKPPQTPFTAIANATLPDQIEVRGSLSTIADLVAQRRLPSPTLLVMGPKPRAPLEGATHLSLPATIAL